MDKVLGGVGCATIGLAIVAGFVLLFWFTDYFLLYLLIVGISVFVLFFVISISLGYRKAKSEERITTFKEISFKDAGITLAIGAASIGCGFVAFQLIRSNVGVDVQQYGQYEVTTTPGPGFIILVPFAIGCVVGIVIFLKRMFGLVKNTSCYLFTKILSASRSKD